MVGLNVLFINNKAPSRGFVYYVDHGEVYDSTPHDAKISIIFYKT